MNLNNWEGLRQLSLEQGYGNTHTDSAFLVWDGTSKNKGRDKLLNIVCKNCYYNDNLNLRQFYREGHLKVPRNEYLRYDKKLCMCYRDATRSVRKAGIDPWKGLGNVTYRSTVSILSSSGQDLEVVCSFCSDPKHYGMTFKSSLGSFTANGIPCMCSKSPKLSKGNLETVLRVEARNMGLTYLSLTGYRGGGCSSCKINLRCDKGHEFTHHSVGGFLFQGSGCKVCAGRCSITAEKNFLELCRKGGIFPTYDSFKSVDNISCTCSKGHTFTTQPKTCRLSDEVCCRVCLGYGKSYFYVNRLTDQGVDVGIKFGVTNNMSRRMQDYKLLPVKSENIFLWKLFAPNEAYEIESFIKRSLVCRVLDKTDFTFYTETTYSYNLEWITNLLSTKGEIM